jgi:hypothetical protein
VPSNPDSTLTAASAAAAVLALFVSLYSLYFTHQATGLREYRKWVREAALPLLAKLHETTIRLLREEERVSLMLHVRIRKSPTDEDRQQFAEMQKSLDVLLFDFRTTSLQLLFLAGRKLRPLLTSQRKYVEELGTATDYDDETDLRESIRKTDVAILEAAAADLGLTGALIRPRHEGFFISAGR